MRKIELPLKEVYEAYSNDNLNVHRLGERYNVSYETIRRRVCAAGITKRKQQKSFGWSDEIKSIIIASLLGDGSLSKITKKHQNSRFVLTNTKKEYLEHVKGILTGHGISCRLIKHSKPGKFIIEGRTATRTQSYRLITQTYVEFTELRKIWYPRDKKSLPEGLTLKRTMLKHWYVQDGSISMKKQPDLSLATHAFSKEEVLYLIDRLKEELKLSPRISSNKGRQYNIRFYSKNALKFLELINGNTVPGYEYKFPEIKDKVIIK